jgi:hypothetical protein
MSFCTRAAASCSGDVDGERFPRAAPDFFAFPALSVEEWPDAALLRGLGLAARLEVDAAEVK